MMNFTRLICQILSLVILLSGPTIAQEKDLLRIGLVAPDEGSLSLLGTQLRAGFYIHEQQFVGPNAQYTLIEETEICDRESGEDTAYALEEAQVDIVVGFLCVESLVGALPILKQNNIPVVNINVRGDIVRDEAARLGWPLISIAPRASDQAKYASRYIIDNWGDRSVALIEDGTIHNRELVDAIRLQLDEGGFQPVVIDNFRPGQDKQFGLVRRLAKSNITHIFAGATRADTSIIARDAASIGVSFNFAGGDTFRAADEGLTLPNGTVAVLADVRLRGKQAKATRKLFDAAGIFPDKFPILGYAMAEMMVELAKGPRDNLLSNIKDHRFQTVVGRITFDQYGERQENIFRAMVWQDGRFVKEAKTQ